MASAQAMLERFKQVFPMWADDIVSYTPGKDNWIKVELTGKRFYFFKFINNLTWKLESVRMRKVELTAENERG
jgi:hypothetical protein